MSDTNDDLEHLLPPFAAHLGVRLTTATPELVVGELQITPEMANRNGVMHGGAIMAFADALGGTASALNLASGETTTTLESKTNFLRPIPIGMQISGHCTALHVGRSTMVLQVTLRRDDGAIAAITSQTQMTLR